MKKILSVLVVFSSVVSFAWADDSVTKSPEARDTENTIHVFSTESTFEDAKEDLLASIADKGLVVSYTAHAKAMFDRTSGITGEKTPVYDNAEIVLFCKADLSYNLVVANPHNIILCPYSIAIYVLHAEPSRVYLSYKAQDKAQSVTKPINHLLKEIIADVL